jgi:ribonuclease BN (tRNA processing enzyme)
MTPGVSRTRVTLGAGADLLLRDSQYTGDEYPRWLGWGHSSTTHGATFARAAGVQQLGFHHDPMRSDGELEELHDQVAAILQRDQEPPLITSEGLELTLGANSRGAQSRKDVDHRA